MLCPSTACASSWLTHSFKKLNQHSLTAHSTLRKAGVLKVPIKREEVVTDFPCCRNENDCRLVCHQKSISGSISHPPPAAPASTLLTAVSLKRRRVWYQPSFGWFNLYQRNSHLGSTRYCSGDLTVECSCAKHVSFSQSLSGSSWSIEMPSGFLSRQPISPVLVIIWDCDNSEAVSEIVASDYE